MIFVDANIFIAHQNKEDVHHKRALEIMKDIENQSYGPAFISDYVFNEVVGITCRKKGKSDAVLAGEKMKRSMSIFNIDEHVLENAWNFFQETAFNFNLVDCTNINIVRTMEVEYIATFDKEFLKME